MVQTAVDLMRRIQGGDASAFDELVTLHRGVLLKHLERYVQPADADDLMQELWLRVWQRAGQWDGRGRLLAWLLAIGTNLALNHLRRQRATVSLAAPGAEDFSETLASASDAVLVRAEEQVLWRDQLDRVLSAMAALPAEKQAALRMVRLEGRSLREAAAALRVPIGTVKSRLHHAQRLLAEYLEEEA